MATTISRHLIDAGHEVVLSSSRGPEALAGLVADLDPAASAGPRQGAAECDVVILATNWADPPEALKEIDWSGRILVDGRTPTWTRNRTPAPPPWRDRLPRWKAARRARSSPQWRPGPGW